MARATVFYQTHLEYVTEVTKMLNNLPSGDPFFLKVTLVDEDGEVHGSWSDEIASDDWQFEPRVWE